MEFYDEAQVVCGNLYFYPYQLCIIHDYWKNYETFLFHDLMLIKDSIKILEELSKYIWSMNDKFRVDNILSQIKIFK